MTYLIKSQNITQTFWDEASDEEWWRRRAPAEDPEPEGIVNQVAVRFRTLSALDRPVADDLCSVTALQRHMAVVAQGSRDCQFQAVQQILQYVLGMQQAGSFKAMLFTQQVHFDESPLKLRVAFHDDPRADLQIGKIVAVQVKWMIPVHDKRRLHDALDKEVPEAVRPDDLLLLTGTLSPQIRATDKGTGEALAAVLHACILRQHEAQQVFQTSVMMYEADSLGANDRAINLLRGEHSASVILRLRCLCHKVHTTAQKSFLLWPNLLQGVSRTLLVLQQPGVFAAFRKALVQLVTTRCRRVEMNVPFDLPEAAQRYREQCLKYFAPFSRRGQVVLKGR